MPDDADRRARDAVTRILTGAMLDRGGHDPHVTAGEIVQVFRAHGWRPVVQPAPPAAAPLRGDRVHQLATQARQAITKEGTDG